MGPDGGGTILISSEISKLDWALWRGKACCKMLHRNDEGLEVGRKEGKESWERKRER